MFVTFYSYKGGVGRTLALANTAYLLASAKREPCRVLLWDFDLEAPGLLHLYRCHWGQRKLGFVDLVDTYLGEAKVPPIAEYIHSSDVPGIDLLPAGHIDEKYSEKLERINWRLVYERASGYDLLEAIKASISSLQPRYDYVLIDSRTGYSDVGGICLHQLPELVVLMFRLNCQNLDGTQKVAHAIRQFSHKTKRQVGIIPVISPAWPFATTEANVQIRKAKKIFRESKLLDISFDSDLTFGEKLIVRERASYEIEPRVLRDYEVLARTIREFNLQDPLTIFRLGEQKLKEHQLDEAYENFSTLVQSRPERLEYWNSWIRSTQSKKLKDRAANFLDTFIKEHPRSASALLTRASLGEKSIDKVLADLNLAIQVNPTFPQAYFQRALMLSENDNNAQALSDFRKYFELTGDPAAEVFLGRCLTSLGDYQGAEEHLKKALVRNPRDPQLYRRLALVNLATGRFADAKSDCLRALALDPNLKGAKVDLVHAMAGLGEREDARSLLNGMVAVTPSDYGDVLNCAEAYIVLEEPATAKSLLESGVPEAERYLVIRNLLMYIASVVEGREDIELANQIAAHLSSRLKAVSSLRWSFVELRSYLQFPSSYSNLSGSDREKLIRLLRQLEAVQGAIADSAQPVEQLN